MCLRWLVGINGDFFLFSSCGHMCVQSPNCMHFICIWISLNYFTNFISKHFHVKIWSGSSLFFSVFFLEIISFSWIQTLRAHFSALWERRKWKKFRSLKCVLSVTSKCKSSTRAFLILLHRPRIKQYRPFCSLFLFTLNSPLASCCLL